MPRSESPSIRRLRCALPLLPVVLAALWLTACTPDAKGPSLEERRASLRESPPRNLLLITLDTTRADALGSYGQPLPASPVLDRLAAEGVLFEQAMSSAPSTLPAHASILTSKYPYAHGARANAGYVLPDDQLTLAEILRAQGFRTAAEVAAPVLGSRTGLDQGFEHYRDFDSFDAEPNRAVYSDRTGSIALELPERLGADITRRGVEFLRAHSDEPFFLWLHYYDPHVLYVAPEAFRLQLPTSRYLAEVRYVDYQVGRVTQELARLGLADETLVVVIADHGEGLDQHGERSHSYFLYDSTIHIPLILWGPPGLPAGVRISSHVRGIDVLPTVLDLLGVEAPGGIHGRSLVPLLTGESDDLELVGYGETLEGHLTFGTSVLRYLREGDWKYIHKVEPELFNVAEDPVEQHNRASEHPEIVERLRARLDGLLAEARATGAGGEVPVDPQTIQQLASLGYVAGPGAQFEETLELSGVDPNETRMAVQRMGNAHGAYKMQRYDLALELFSALDEEFPDRVPVLAGLVDTLRALGRDEEAIPLLRRSLAVAPDFVPHLTLLGELLRAQGELEEAEGLLRAAVGHAPCFSGPRIELGNVLLAQGRFAEQLDLLEEGTQRCPESLEFRNDLAYALATTPDDDRRDGARALAIIEPIVASEVGENPAYLDTLAAACAEEGDFDRALESARKALALVRGRDLPAEALASFHRTLTTVKERRPVRMQP